MERLHQELYMFGLTTWHTPIPKNLFLRVALVKYLEILNICPQTFLQHMRDFTQVDSPIKKTF